MIESPILPDRIRLGCLQFDIRRGDPSANQAVAARLLAEAAQSGCHLAILPEMWTAGFAAADLCHEAEQLDSRKEFIATTAQRHQMWIAAGTLPEPAGDGLVSNALFLFDPQGQERWSFRKVHLFPQPFELSWFRAAKQPATPLKIGSWSLGGGICYDLRMPELFREQMKQGVNLFLLPAQFPDPRLEHFTLLCQARALENLAFFVGVNRIGKEGALTHSGGSLVVGPFGRILASLGDCESLLVVDLDVQTVHETRRHHPFLRNTVILDHWLDAERPSR